MKARSLSVLRWLIAHAWAHRALYIWLPASIFLVLGALRGYRTLTGREPLDDAPIGAIWNFVLLVVAVILTAWTKPLLFDDIDTREFFPPDKRTERVPFSGTDQGAEWRARTWRIAIDSLETAFLLSLFSFFLLRA